MSDNSRRFLENVPIDDTDATSRKMSRDIAWAKVEWYHSVIMDRYRGWLVGMEAVKLSGGGRAWQIYCRQKPPQGPTPKKNNKRK